MARNPDSTRQVLGTVLLVATALVLYIPSAVILKEKMLWVFVAATCAATVFAGWPLTERSRQRHRWPQRRDVYSGAASGVSTQTSYRRIPSSSVRKAS